MLPLAARGQQISGGPSRVSRGAPAPPPLLSIILCLVLPNVLYLSVFLCLFCVLGRAVPGCRFLTQNLATPFSVHQLIVEKKKEKGSVPPPSAFSTFSTSAVSQTLTHVTRTHTDRSQIITNS